MKNAAGDKPRADKSELAVYDIYGRLYLFDSNAQTDEFPTNITFYDVEKAKFTARCSSEIRSIAKYVKGQAADSAISKYLDSTQGRDIISTDQLSVSEKIEILKNIALASSESTPKAKKNRIQICGDNTQKPFVGDIVADPEHPEYGLGIIKNISDCKIIVLFSGLKWAVNYSSHSGSKRLIRVATWIEPTTDRHKKILNYCGIQTVGATESRAAITKRASYCWLCREYINSADLLVCDGCGWMVCHCGACGCNYGK